MNRLQKKAFKKLLFLSRQKKEDGRSHVLSRVAMEFSIYLISSFTGKELEAGKYNQCFESLRHLGSSFGEYIDGEPIPPNRIDEVLLELSSVGLLTYGRAETTSRERDEYSYSSNKQMWEMTVSLDQFIYGDLKEE